MLVSSCKTKAPVDIEGPEAPTPPVRRADDIGTAGYQTAVGDALDIFVLEDASFNSQYIVRPSGDIIIPKAGRVQVLGMTLAQVEGTVKAVLEQNQLRQATVVADPVRRGASSAEGQVSAGLTIYLSGNVTRTGRVLVPFVGGGQVTAYQAIMDAGGFTPFANKRKSYVLRRNAGTNTQRIPVNFDKIEKSEEPDLALQDGDMLVVPQKLIGL
ncbi:polysaccharide biosynthesis/export family protein [Brevifollis gellanilyticus]|uniref:Sugar ABC transporter substrate-binding protein n=1 Tax=Brevifollis gellanilyticus TaxID=748831 RepID=A0A512M3Y6_9BACT|nr:polysaccharide biosynthesis/export family protein [Brevifollis gellanilyticus]GEP41442.1 sugar ABC transporter substrate-binding protein [Brevifollis gellanilyticus]